jgi:hypothetical protein
MERKDKKSCVFEDRSYEHGSELCDTMECLVCVDGKWTDMDNLDSAGC